MHSRVFVRTGTLIVLALLVLGTTGCSGAEDARVDFLADTEPRAYDEVPIPSARIEELRQDVAQYEERVSETVRNYQQVASYQKLLGHELIQAEMYGPALEALQRAMELQPGNAVLLYFAGVAAAQTARGHILDGRETVYLERAERLFTEALDLRPEYKDALFAMAVLLAFDLDKAEEAIQYSRRLSELETGDPSVRFLHANVLVRNGQVEEAIAVYDDLARTAPGTEQRNRARENRDTLEEQRR